LNIQQLEYIIAVDQFKSFSSAAEHCYVTQANLMAMVRKLEVELDTVFFDRRSKSVVTTQAGIALIEEAKKIVQHSQLLMDKAKNINRTIGGHVKIGMLPTIANSLLPMISEPLFNYFPDLNLEVTELTAESIIEQVKSGQLDMGIVASKVTPLEIGKVILFHEALMVYGDLYPNKVLMYDEGGILKDHFLSLFSIDEKLFKNFNTQAGKFKLLLDEVDKLGGSTLIPELYFQTLSDDKKERVSSFPIPAPVREISLVYHKKYTNGKIVQALADLIRNHVNETLKSHQFFKQELTICSI
jgi:LysR family hydrogen peroxide-inducible transcriptional activator